MQKIEISNVFKQFTNTFSDLEFIKLIKTGKEAEVYLVRSKGILMALKSYRTNTKYSSKHTYLNINEIRDSRIQRAIKSKNRIGRSAMEFIWARREYTLLKKLSKIGANVPKVYSFGVNSVLMQYIGDLHKPALRLIESKITKNQAEFILDEVIKNIYLLMECGFIHGDLSEFNILLYQNKPYIIDFPQAVDIKNNPNAYSILKKDIFNLRKYFSKFECSNISLLDELEEYAFNDFGILL